MKAFINGEEKQLPDPVNVKYIVSHYKLDPSKVVIEHNGRILKHDDWGQAVVVDNDKIEIISFVGGG